MSDPNTLKAKVLNILLLLVALAALVCCTIVALDYLAQGMEVPQTLISVIVELAELIQIVLPALF